MNLKLTYLETHSVNPYYNLAFEEYVLCHRTDGDYLLLWQNDNTIVVGQNQNTEAEINHNFVEAHNINVVRRTTGGGAVYHDLGNLNYSFITDVGEQEQLTMERFTGPIVSALRTIGLDAEVSGRNDILVSGRKVSGTAQRVVGHRILHHGTLLFCANPSMVAGALNVDPAKFQSKGSKSVRSRIGNIREFLKEDMELENFWEYLKSSLGRTDMGFGCLTENELFQVDALKKTKYDTWEWNFGKSPPCNYINSRRWDGGLLEVRIAIETGVIRQIQFYGDFLSLHPLDDITSAIQNCPFRKEDIEQRLSRFPVSKYFGGITQEEILSTIF